MTTRKACMRLIEEHDATWFEDTSGQASLIASAWSPPGWAWVSNGSHCLSIYAFTRADRPDEWRDLYSRMVMGTERCTQERCDTCAEAENQPAVIDAGPRSPHPEG